MSELDTRRAPAPFAAKMIHRDERAGDQPMEEEKQQPARIAGVDQAPGSGAQNALQG